MLNILVTGSNSQLGSKLQEEANKASLQDFQLFFTDKDELDISNQADIKNIIETKKYPNLVKRPLYSLLNKAEIKETFNVIIPYWKDRF